MFSRVSGSQAPSGAAVPQPKELNREEQEDSFFFTIIKATKPDLAEADTKKEAKNLKEMAKKIEFLDSTYLDFCEIRGVEYMLQTAFEIKKTIFVFRGNQPCLDEAFTKEGEQYQPEEIDAHLKPDLSIHQNANGEFSIFKG